MSVWRQFCTDPHGEDLMPNLRTQRWMWLTPDWSNWVLMTAIVLLVAALAFYFYAFYAV